MNEGIREIRIAPLASSSRGSVRRRVSGWSPAEVSQPKDSEDQWFQVFGATEAQARRLMLPRIETRRHGDSALDTLFLPTSYSEFRSRFPAHPDLEDRLRELDIVAVEEDISPDAASKQGLWNFILAANVSAYPKVTLRDNGKYRAVWETNDVGQVGVEFETESHANYVILREFKPDGLERHYGSCHLARLESIVEAVGMLELLKDGSGGSTLV